MQKWATTKLSQLRCSISMMMTVKKRLYLRVVGIENKINTKDNKCGFLFPFVVVFDKQTKGIKRMYSSSSKRCNNNSRNLIVSFVQTQEGLNLPRIVNQRKNTRKQNHRRCCFVSGTIIRRQKFWRHVHVFGKKTAVSLSRARIVEITWKEGVIGNGTIGKIKNNCGSSSHFDNGIVVVVMIDGF